MSPLPRSDAEPSEPPNPAQALAAERPAYVDFARIYVQSKGVSDRAEITAIADDAVQNAWIALEHNPSFDPAQAARPWIKQHIRTAARDLIRPKKTADGLRREERASGHGVGGLMSEDDAYAFLAGAAGYAVPDEGDHDRQRLHDWVDAHVSDYEREMLRLGNLGYVGRHLTDRLNAAFSRTERAGTIATRLNRLIKRLAKGYAATLRPADLL